MLPLILVAVGAYLIGDSVLGDKKYAKGGQLDAKSAKKRLEQLRKELRAERISYGELAELESLKEYIDEDDVELRQAAGIPEFDEDEYKKGGQLEVGDMVMVDDSGYAKYFSGFDVSKPAKIISKNKGKSFGKVKYFYGLETADGKKPFNQAIESMLTKVSKDGGMMAHGGKTQGYDDKEDERLAMEHGKMSKKDLDSTHARRDDAEFEERGKMAKGGEVGGRGWEGATKGKRIKNIKEFEKNHVYLNYDPRFNSKNLIMITGLDKTGLNRPIVYGSFLRKGVRENDFAIWDDELKDNEFYEAKDKKFADEYMAKGGKIKGVVKISTSEISDIDFQSLNDIFDSNDAMFSLDESEEYVVMDLNELPDGDDKDDTYEILGRYNVKKYVKGGKLVGKQKNLDVNKNGKLDAEDFKMLRGDKMADGGMMDVVNTEVIKVKGNIMGTTSLELKIKGMRKPQDFIVYPISTDQAGKPITIQSDTRFGYLDLSSGRGLMSQSHANGAYGYHFASDKKVPFKISETDVQKIKEHLSSKASSKAGNSVIFSDNSGADKMAKGGETSKKKIKREGNHLMHFEPYFEKEVQVASINEDSKTIRPSSGYFHPNAIGKKSINWAKKNGYKFIQDGKEF
jgi:hypothetical protein